MNLRTFLDSLPRGGVSEFASRIGVTLVYLSQIAAGQDGRVPSPRLCVVIERESHGVTGRKDLRPYDWHLIWPELAESEPNPPAAPSPQAPAAINSEAQGAA